MQIALGLYPAVGINGAGHCVVSCVVVFCILYFVFSPTTSLFVVTNLLPTPADC